jgi:hypothetical protein
MVRVIFGRSFWSVNNLPRGIAGVDAYAHSTKYEYAWCSYNILVATTALFSLM